MNERQRRVLERDDLANAGDDGAVEVDMVVKDQSAADWLDFMASARRADDRFRQRQEGGMGEQEYVCDKCKGEGRAPHECPYRAEINNDHDTLCSCCERCAHDCAMDV